MALETSGKTHIHGGEENLLEGEKCFEKNNKSEYSRSGSWVYVSGCNFKSVGGDDRPYPEGELEAAEEVAAWVSWRRGLHAGGTAVQRP